MQHKTTILQSYKIIVGDKKIITKKNNLNKIRNSSFSSLIKINNTELAFIYSTYDIDFGSIECSIYPIIKKGNKPISFYYIPTNSLKHIKIKNLIKMIDNNCLEKGNIKIETGKICFKVTGNMQNMNSGYIPEKGEKSEKNKKMDDEFKKWNNTFFFDVKNGLYEIFQFDFYYNLDSDYNHYDTMFLVKKKNGE